MKNININIYYTCYLRFTLFKVYLLKVTVFYLLCFLVWLALSIHIFIVLYL